MSIVHDMVRVAIAGAALAAAMLPAGHAGAATQSAVTDQPPLTDTIDDPPPLSDATVPAGSNEDDPRPVVPVERAESITGPAAATPIQVTTTADSGSGSLREAISNANASPGHDTIEFVIPGSTVPAIELSSRLLIHDAVTIDGFSQPGTTANSAVSPAPMNGSLLIELDGSSVPIDTEPCVEVRADDVTILGVVINGCSRHGIFAFEADDLVVQGCYIGVDRSGLVDVGAGRDHTGQSIAHGINLTSGARARIGGTSPADRNIVAGNQAGDILLNNEPLSTAHPSESHVVQGNYIGVGADGLTALPSGWVFGIGNAILLGNTHDDLIGGATAGAANVIGSSYEYGVAFRQGTTGTRIEGNLVGTDFTGLRALEHDLGSGHVSDGVHVAIVRHVGFTLPVSGVVVGGPTPAHRNVISGNTAADPAFGAPGGVAVEDGGHTSIVEGNFIGVGADGSTPVPNGGTGVTIAERADNSAVRSNVVSGNGGVGISIADSRHVEVTGNNVGLTAGGTDAGNGSIGLLIFDGSSHVVVGASTGGHNVIGANGWHGIAVADASDIDVLDNLVGLDSSSERAAPNNGDGILVTDGSTNVTIGNPGGNAPVVSGNAGNGITVRGSDTSAVSIDHVFVGTNGDGTTAIGNADIGIEVTDGVTGTSVGTSTNAANVISGNGDAGIVLNAGPTLVRGNIVGLDATGQSPIGNRTWGIAVVESAGNVIGGSTADAANTVSASTINGIIVWSGGGVGSAATANVIQGNRVGTTVDGRVRGVGNGYAGIGFGGGAHDNLVGGTGPGEGNLIAGNNAFAAAGALSTAPAVAVDNSFVGNSIHDNAGPGLDLMQSDGGPAPTSEVGPTANDLGDGDGGTNDLLNHPVVTDATFVDRTLTITYDLDIDDLATGVTGYHVEFFGNPSPAVDSFAQALFPLGSATVAGDVVGEIFTFVLPSMFPAPTDAVVTATVTEIDGSLDGFGSTSEISSPAGIEFSP